MDLPTPTQLAPLLPLGPNEVIFQYDIHLDGAFEADRITGAAKVDLTDLPAQISKMVYHSKDRTGERWAIGVNIFRDGVDVRYQPFFWLGEAPAPGHLDSRGKFQRAGGVYTLDMHNLQEASVNVPSHPWLSCAVRPVLCEFSLAIVGGVATPNPATPTPQIVKTSTFRNDSSSPVRYSPTISYEYDQTLQVSITDTHTFKAGTKLTWEGEVDWFVEEAKFSFQLTFEYDYSHAKTTASETSRKYIISEPLDFTLQPGEKRYVSVILYADENASANISLDYRLAGRINGIDLNGSFLQELAEAMAATRVKSIDGNSLVYTIDGIIHANVVADSKVEVDNDVPTILQGAAVAA